VSHITRSLAGSVPVAVANSVPLGFDKVLSVAVEVLGVPVAAESKRAPFAGGAAVGSIMPQLVPIAPGAWKKNWPPL